MFSAVRARNSVQWGVKFFDAGQHAQGFIAIGQEATGVIAIGQSATGFFALGQTALGFIAIGQLARGVFVVGQLAIGIVAVGQLGLGVWGSVGMLAVAGRWTKGWGFAIWPKPKPDESLPETISLLRVENGEKGYVEIEVDETGTNLTHEGLLLNAELNASAQAEASAMVERGSKKGLLLLEQKERLTDDDPGGYRRAAPTMNYLEGYELVAVPPPEWKRQGFWLKASVRTLGIAALGTGWFFAAAYPFFEAMFAAKTGLFGAL